MGYCFLCDRTMNYSKETPMYKFPKNPSLKAAWLKFCNLNETDDVSTVKLCSAHFTAADSIEPRTRELGSTAFLKPGTVPSILKPPLGSSGTIHTDNLSNRKPDWNQTRHVRG
ncbi:uncharacterized protein LOC115878244 isoform X2 [Sitophilus oryzae]|uniref:Uncharacterized protein LOC115878244 isoform X2 n=1 Tax=Sitophilus oryzae TaxID=7048 RepID=A0A6J2XIM2_SITOR|nr:uncharacterized protein LOC115878244 isoform X2 [Sitophilus oryzae]